MKGLKIVFLAAISAFTLSLSGCNGNNSDLDHVQDKNFQVGCKGVWPKQATLNDLTVKAVCLDSKVSGLIFTNEKTKSLPKEVEVTFIQGGEILPFKVAKIKEIGMVIIPKNKAESEVAVFVPFIQINYQSF